MDVNRIEELTTNNDAPSNEAVREVERILLKPLEDLENLDAEILNLGKRLEDLKIKRTETQKWITRYKSILSPIRRMPADMLGEIFYHCLPTHRNPIMKTTECPMLLTRICSTWRAAAMSSPRLWARLYITFSDDDMVPDSESFAVGGAGGGQIPHLGPAITMPKLEKQRATQRLRMRCDVVKEWLSRSGTRPLSISICFTSNFWYTGPHSQPSLAPNITLELFAFLASLSPRFEDLELKMSIEMYRILEGMITISKMTTLTSLRAEYHAQIPGTPDGFSPIMLLNAPNLRKISMYACDPRLWGILNPRTSFSSNGLTDISCHNVLSITEITYLLEHSPNLIHFKAIIVEDLDDETTPVSFRGHISLPFLRTLHIIENIDPRRLGNIYDCIDAPGLQWVIYISQFYPGAFSADSPPPIPIIPLLRKSTGLKKLTIDASDITAWDVGRIFRVVPTITHLVIGPEVRTNTGSLARASPYVSYSRAANDSSLNLDRLVVGNTPASELGVEGGLPMLPHLESFEVSSGAVHIEDKSLLDFVMSRMPNLFSSSVTQATLKHVGVVFYRKKERNIAEEIMRHAALVGREINLQLDYPDLPPQWPETISPEFGLRSSDGGSWAYVDVGEFVEWYILQH